MLLALIFKVILTNNKKSLQHEVYLVNKVRGEIPKGKHFAKSNFEKIRVKVFETILVLEGLFCDVLMKIWYQKKA